MARVDKMVHREAQGRRKQAGDPIPPPPLLIFTYTTNAARIVLQVMILAHTTYSCLIHFILTGGWS